MLLTTKFFTPRRQPQFVPRPRLMRQLDVGLTGALILVSAPPGFGKTSLVADWLHSRTVREGASEICSQAWLSLDEQDNDPARFLHYAVAALQRVDCHIGERIVSLLQSTQPPKVEELTTLLVNDLARIERPFLLTLDDYHVIHNLAIHQAITFLIENMPAGGRLVIITRSDPPLPLARWRARRELSEVREQDLRFSPDETVRYFAQNAPIGLADSMSEHDLHALAARTEGWVAGLQLAAISLAEHPNPGEFVRAFTGAHAMIVDYLTEEVIHQQPAEIQAFLLQTSVLDRLSAPLCAAVMGLGAGDVHASQQTLERVERANLFLIPLDNERRWYRYHHLFAEMLRRASRRADPVTIAQRHERASIWYEAQRLRDEAIHHALAGEAYERAGRLIEADAERLLLRGEAVTLVSWLDRLPPAELLRRPRLCIARAQMHMLFHQLDAAEAAVAAAVDRLATDTAVEGDSLLGEILVLRANIALNRSRLDEAIHLGEEALAQLPADRLHRRAESLLYIAIAYVWQARYTHAQRYYAEAAKVAILAGSPLYAIQAMVYLAQLYRFQAKIDLAHRQLQDAAEYAASQRIDGLPLMAAYHVNLADLFYEQNQLAKATEAVVEGVTCARQAQNVRTLVGAHAKLLRIQYAQGDREAVAATCSFLREQIGQHDFPAQIVYDTWLELARVAVRSGDLETARRWAKLCGLSADAPQCATRESEYTNLARLLAAQGNPEAALRLLAQVVESAQTLGKQTAQVEALAVISIVMRQAGERVGALRILEQVIRLAAPTGLVRTLIDEGEPMQRLLAELRLRLAAPNLVTYVERLLDVFEPQETPTPPASEQSTLHTAIRSLVAPLSEREMEVLQLVATGCSDREIADRLVVVVGTVKRHLNNIYGKLLVHSRTQALARARELGLLEGAGVHM